MIDQILNNKIILAAFLAWLVAQVLKVILVLVKDRKVDFSRMIGSGGMPSSHSALVMAMTSSVGKYVGFDTAEFAIAACISIIVMYDAANVRRAAGKQAELLNIIVDDLYRGKHIDGEKLKELLGHTPVEVAAGAVLGICMGSYL